MFTRTQKTLMVLIKDDWKDVASLANLACHHYSWLKYFFFKIRKQLYDRMILFDIFKMPCPLNLRDVINKSSIFKEEKRENIRTGWYWVFLSSGSFVFLFNGWNLSVTCKIALACFILYRKTLSTFGITCFVDTRSTTRQIAIRPIISVSTCYQKKVIKWIHIT